MDPTERFLKAFDEYQDALFRHGYFRVHDREVVHDLVQDTFTKTWDYLVKGNDVEQFRPFLYRTLNNLIIDHYRKKRSDSLDLLLEEGNVPEGAFDELKEGGLADLEMALDAKEMLLVLPEMPPLYHQAVTMRYLDGLMPQEIADMTGESVNVISVRIHRGLAWLKKRIER